MSRLTRCPACQASGLETVAAELEGPGVTSDSRPAAGEVQDALCSTCGLVVNVAGARGNTDRFYAGEYDLLAEDPTAEFLAYQSGKAVGINEHRFDFLAQSLLLPERGRILEIGAGKGLFLLRFAAHFPEWEVCAVEPSRNATRYFRALIPQSEVYEGPFETSPFRGGSFDLIVALGVLEHVPDPLSFLTAVRESLTPAGRLYLEVPNFLNNPSDLLCYDHLTRFVPETLANLLRAGGFETAAAAAPTDQVAMRLVATPTTRPGPMTSEARRIREILEAHARFIQQVFTSYQRCAEDSRAQAGRMALFGLGIIGLAGILRGHVRREGLTAFIDDNWHFWGSRRLGVPVGGVNLIGEWAISHIAFAVNPCYLSRIVTRLQPLRVQLFLPGAA